MTGDEWCDLLVAGPMSRTVCHLALDLVPAECGLLLSRLHNAEQLEELSLVVSSFQYPSTCRTITIPCGVSMTPKVHYHLVLCLPTCC